MPFYSFKKISTRQLAAGVELRAVAGEKMTLTLFSMAEGAAIPEHSHPHEQIGTLLSGSMELIVGDEKKIVTKGRSVGDSSQPDAPWKMPERTGGSA